MRRLSRSGSCASIEAGVRFHFIGALLLATALCGAAPLNLKNVDAGGERHYSGTLQAEGVLSILGDGDLHFTPARPTAPAGADILISNHAAIEARLGMSDLAGKIDMSTYCAVEVHARLRLDAIIVGPDSTWTSARARLLEQQSTAQLRGCEKQPE